MLSQSHIDAYAKDGVAFVKGAFSPDWIAKLTQGINDNIANPSTRSRIWNRDAEGRTCFYDSQVWQQIDAYRDFALHSPCGEMAATLMGSKSVNFFFDAVFVRTPGAQFRTPWHQDEPYWSVNGFDTCSVWMPLVPVEKKSALEFVRGSHLWNQKYKQTNFGALTKDDRDQVRFDDCDTVPFPDVENNRADYDILSWDMEPGDCVAFNARIIHGGSGNLSEGRDLKVFNTQWLGDDVRVMFRPEGMDPDHSQVMTEHGLKPGDRPQGPLYPQVWHEA
jgi:ectoine hydroxylase-related dioxygenase (phytanoyl-CoA dioxygenase family)